MQRRHLLAIRRLALDRKRDVLVSQCFQRRFWHQMLA
jgi:hypothetical protein